MAGTKIKLNELVKPGTFVADSIDEVNSTAIVAVSKNEMIKIEKKVVAKVLDALLSGIQTELKNGNSIEFPHTLNIGSHTSSVRTYKEKDAETGKMVDTGKLKRSVTARTREKFSRSLNN